MESIVDLSGSREKVAMAGKKQEEDCFDSCSLLLAYIERLSFSFFHKHLLNHNNVSNLG